MASTWPEGNPVPVVEASTSTLKLIKCDIAFCGKEVQE